MWKYLWKYLNAFSNIIANKMSERSLVLIDTVFIFIIRNNINFVKNYLIRRETKHLKTNKSFLILDLKYLFQRNYWCGFSSTLSGA